MGTEEPDIIRSPDTERGERVPPGQSAVSKWPVLHHGGVPAVDLSTWSFRIFGHVEEERELTFEEFAALPNVRVYSDIHCVTGWTKLGMLWEGVSAMALRELAPPKENARYVIVHAVGGFTTNLSLDDFFQPDVLFALSADGEPLSAEHGYPVRLVVPRLYFWKSAKWVTGIEYAEEDEPGFWETKGYNNHGDPWKEERYGVI